MQKSINKQCSYCTGWVHDKELPITCQSRVRSWDKETGAEEFCTKFSIQQYAERNREALERLANK